MQNYNCYTHVGTSILAYFLSPLLEHKLLGQGLYFLLFFPYTAASENTKYNCLLNEKQIKYSILTFTLTF